MKKVIIMFVGMLMLSGSMMAQENVKSRSDQKPEAMPKKQKKVTYVQITEQMVKELQLNEKQQKKVTKLNKKYKTLIEGMEMERPQGQRPPMGERPSGNDGGRPSGGGMPGGGFGGDFGGGMPGGGFGGGMPGGGFGGGMPGGQSQEKTYDYDKNQKKYDKAIGKILSEQQYEKYLKIKPQFASQRSIRDFLLGK